MNTALRLLKGQRRIWGTSEDGVKKHSWVAAKTVDKVAKLPTHRIVRSGKSGNPLRKYAHWAIIERI